MDVLNLTMRRMVSGGVVRQKTLKRDIECTGIALHSGLTVKMRICAAAPDFGYLFSQDGCRPKNW